MRISQAVNRTIFHLRHQLFGPGRFDPVDVRRVHFSPKRVGSVNLHRAGPLQQSRSAFTPRPDVTRLNDSFKSNPWPYDTAFPSGLPEVTLFPGQQLTDMPATGGKLAQRHATDHALGTTLMPPRPNGRPGTADHLGTIIDVFA